MNIKKLSPNAIIPTKAHNTDAGYDLYSTEECELKPMERKPIKTGIAMSIPNGFFGRISPRSGLAAKKGIDVMGGIIDVGYIGELMAILINLSSEPFKINIGDKIAQIILSPCASFPLIEVDTLEDTERGTKGFGSSDLKTVMNMPVSNIELKYKSLITGNDIDKVPYEQKMKSQTISN